MALYSPTHLAMLWLHHPKAAPLECRCRGHSLVSDPSSHLLHYSNTRQIHWFPGTLPLHISPVFTSYLRFHGPVLQALFCKHLQLCDVILCLIDMVKLQILNESNENSDFWTASSCRRKPETNYPDLIITLFILVLQCLECPINMYNYYVTTENKKNEVHHIPLKFLIISKRHLAILVSIIANS